MEIFVLAVWVVLTSRARALFYAILTMYIISYGRLIRLRCMVGGGLMRTHLVYNIAGSEDDKNYMFWVSSLVRTYYFTLD